MVISWPNLLVYFYSLIVVKVALVSGPLHLLFPFSWNIISRKFFHKWLLSILWQSPLKDIFLYYPTSLTLWQFIISYFLHSTYQFFNNGSRVTIKITTTFCVHLYFNERLPKECQLHSGSSYLLISCSAPAWDQCPAYTSHSRSVDWVCKE